MVAIIIMNLSNEFLSKFLFELMVLSCLLIAKTIGQGPKSPGVSLWHLLAVDIGSLPLPIADILVKKYVSGTSENKPSEEVQVEIPSFQIQRCVEWLLIQQGISMCYSRSLSCKCPMN